MGAAHRRNPAQLYMRWERSLPRARCVPSQHHGGRAGPTDGHVCAKTDGAGARQVHLAGMRLWGRASFAIGTPQNPERTRFFSLALVSLAVTHTNTYRKYSKNKIAALAADGHATPLSASSSVAVPVACGACDQSTMISDARALRSILAAVSHRLRETCLDCLAEDVRQVEHGLSEVGSLSAPALA